jgi:hypothetical protein
MMKAGLSYHDWRVMSHFQRKDWLARFTIEQSRLGKRLEKASKDGMGAVLSVVISKLMGLG